MAATRWGLGIWQRRRFRSVFQVAAERGLHLSTCRAPPERRRRAANALLRRGGQSPPAMRGLKPPLYGERRTIRTMERAAMSPGHWLRFAACAALMITTVLGADIAAAQVTPAATLRLTLDDAVRRAIDNNPELAIVRLSTDVEVTRVAESRGAFVPQFSTILGRSGDITPPSNFLLGDRGVGINDWFSSTGVRQRVPWGGGTWSGSWDASGAATTNPLANFDPSLESGIQLALSQPLLKDRTVDSARQQYIIARRNQDTSELRFREAHVQTVAAVKQAYWTFKATLANVTVQQRSLELAQELVRQNKARVDVGQAPPIDLVQAEAEVAQRRESLIRANTGAGDAEDRLRRLMMNANNTSFWRTR